MITSLFVGARGIGHTWTRNACHLQRLCKLWQCQASVQAHTQRVEGGQRGCCDEGGARREEEEGALNCRRARSRRPDSPGARLSTGSSGAGVSQAQKPWARGACTWKQECRCAAPLRRCAACSQLARARRRAPARPRRRLLLACAPPPRARGRPWVRAATTRARTQKSACGHAATAAACAQRTAAAARMHACERPLRASRGADSPCAARPTPCDSRASAAARRGPAAAPRRR
jgi:hypothetical protein